MSTKPILFNTDMVRALLSNKKTVTRRVVKPQPICYGPYAAFKPHNEDFFLPDGKPMLRCGTCGNYPQYSREGTEISHYWVPPYRPGDVLYVRETWDSIPVSPGGHFRPNGVWYYKADGDLRPETWQGKWRPSIHMPREAARIFLRVTDVRVERLRDITLEDGYKEGLDIPTHFDAVWDSTIKKSDRALYGWDANPWVWVIEFERISREEGR